MLKRSVMLQWRRLRRSTLAAYAAAAAGVAGMTWLLYLVPHGIANVSMLYLLVIFGAALLYGRGPALVAGVLAYLAIDWFFVQPHSLFTAKSPDEWIALGMFVFTAAVTGHLTARLRAQKTEATQREHEAVTLAQASWTVASRVEADPALLDILRRVVRATAAEAGTVWIPQPGGSFRLVAPPSNRPPDLREPDLRRNVDAVIQLGTGRGWDTGHVSRARLEELHLPADVFLPLRMEERVLGVLHLRWPEDITLTPEQQRVATSLTNLAALVLQRDQLLRVEAHARALGEADRLKTALLQMVSHDFHTPLATVTATITGLLQEGAPLDPASQRELLEMAREETNRLARMVNNILALSRLEAGAWRPRCEWTPVEELVGAAIDTFCASDKDRIRLDYDPELAQAWLDEVQIVQVLHNLIENALKYSPADQPVELKVAPRDGQLVLEVLDYGTGLPCGEEAQLFKQFYRAPQLREGSVPGLGIGLALCRGLVEAHHGTLTALNRSGAGAHFIVSLPMTPPAGVPSETLPTP